MNRDNPFYHNYLFTKEDLQKINTKFTFRDKLRLLFKPMYVQINDGYVFFFKQIDNEYFLYKYELLTKESTP